MYQLSSWFSDLMDVYRVVTTATNGLSRPQRQLVSEAVPCRVYSNQKNNINLRNTAATVREDEKLACAIDTDIQAGDELIVTRGGAMGRSIRTERYIASQPTLYFDPIGSAATGLEHMEVGLLADNIVR